GGGVWGGLARRYLTVVIQPSVLQLRRLIIAEADRFPDLARTYYERVPGHTLTSLGSCFQDLVERGLLQTDDPALAARQFAWLVLGQPLNQAMFCGYDGPISAPELDHLADASVRVFLAAYPTQTPGPAQPTGPSRAARRMEAAVPYEADAAADGSDTGGDSARSGVTVTPGRIQPAARARCGSVGVTARPGS